MDVVSLRRSLAEVRRNAPGLAAAPLDALEGRLETTQQCMQSSDSSAGLSQTVHAVQCCLERAQRCFSDTAGVSQTLGGGDQTSRQHDVGQCITEIYECVLLVDLALEVLSSYVLRQPYRQVSKSQLTSRRHSPTGPQAKQTTEELQSAANILQDAYRRSGGERLKLFREALSSSTRSGRLHAFFESVWKQRKDPTGRIRRTLE